MSLVYPRIEADETHSDWGDKLASNNQHRRSKSQVTPQEENVQGKLGNSTNRVVLNYHKTTLTGQNQTTWLLVSALYYLPLSSAKLFQICPSYIQTCWWIPTPFKFYYTVALNSWLCNWVFPSWPFCCQPQTCYQNPLSSIPDAMKLEVAETSRWKGWSRTAKLKQFSSYFIQRGLTLSANLPIAGWEQLNRDLWKGSTSDCLCNKGK